MGRIAFALAAVACVSGVWAGTPSGGDGVVHLDGPASLAQLRATNPVHYARARKIIGLAMSPWLALRLTWCVDGRRDR